jgi:hypothetical protein
MQVNLFFISPILKSELQIIFEMSYPFITAIGLNLTVFFEIPA